MQPRVLNKKRDKIPEGAVDQVSGETNKGVNWYRGGTKVKCKPFPCRGDVLLKLALVGILKGTNPGQHPRVPSAEQVVSKEV